MQVRKRDARSNGIFVPNRKEPRGVPVFWHFRRSCPNSHRPTDVDSVIRASRESKRETSGQAVTLSSDTLPTAAETQAIYRTPSLAPCIAGDVQTYPSPKRRTYLQDSTPGATNTICPEAALSVTAQSWLPGLHSLHWGRAFGIGLPEPSFRIAKMAVVSIAPWYVQVQSRCRVLNRWNSGIETNGHWRKWWRDPAAE